MGNPDTPGFTEPTAGQRALARSLYGTYVALREVGFDHDDALGIVTSVTGGVSAALGGDDGHD